MLAAILRVPLYTFVLAQLVLDQANLDDPSTMVEPLINALLAGQWKLAIPLGIMLLIYAIRQAVIPRFADRYPFLADKRFTLALTLVTGLLSVIIPALFAGMPITVALVTQAILYGLGAIGFWSGIKNTREAVELKKLVPSKSPSLVIGGDKLK